MKIKNNIILISLCSIGLLIRIIYIAFYNQGIVWPDEKRYWEEALNISNHWSFLHANMYANDMPLTAIIVGIFQKVTHADILGAKILVAFVSACTIYFIGKMTYAIYPSKISLWLAGAIAAFYPFFIYYSSLILSETFFLFFVCFFFWCLQEESIQKTILSGVAAGFAHLTRPTILFFLPVILIWKYFLKKYSFKRLLLFLSIFCILIVPWVIRNYIVFGEILISSSTSGHALWEGNNPWNKTGGVAEANWGYLKNMPQGMSELEQIKWKRNQAVKYITTHPANFIRLAFKKFFRFWHIWPNVEGFNRGIYRWVAFASFGPLLLLTLLSLWGLKKQWRSTIIIWLFFAYYTALHMITIGSIRYRLPLEPLMIVLTSAFLAKSYDTLKSSRQARLKLGMCENSLTLPFS